MLRLLCSPQIHISLSEANGLFPFFVKKFNDFHSASSITQNPSVSRKIHPICIKRLYFCEFFTCLSFEPAPTSWLTRIHPHPEYVCFGRITTTVGYYTREKPLKTFGPQWELLYVFEGFFGRKDWLSFSFPPGVRS